MNRHNGTIERVDLTIGYERRPSTDYESYPRLAALGVPRQGIIPEDISLSEEDCRKVCEYLGGRDGEAIDHNLEQNPVESKGGVNYGGVGRR